MGDPRVSSTACEVKFSDGIRLMNSTCLCFSFLRISATVGSASVRFDVSSCVPLEAPVSCKPHLWSQDLNVASYPVVRIRQRCKAPRSTQLEGCWLVLDGDRTKPGALTEQPAAYASLHLVSKAPIELARCIVDYISADNDIPRILKVSTYRIGFCRSVASAIGVYIASSLLNGVFNAHGIPSKESYGCLSLGYRFPRI